LEGVPQLGLYRGVEGNPPFLSAGPTWYVITIISLLVLLDLLDDVTRIAFAFFQNVMSCSHLDEKKAKVVFS
jgi:hypothetical protein